MAKKSVSKKIVKAKKTAERKVKSAEKKALKSNDVKSVKPERKKLGKGLEDISTLFLSDSKKDTAAAKNKAAKSSVKKPQGIKADKIKKEVKPVKLKSVKNEEKPSTAKKSASSAAKKTVAKKESTKLVKKSDVSKVEASKAAKSIKPSKPISLVLKKTVVAEENVPKKTVAENAKKAAVVKGKVSKKTTALSDKKTAINKTDLKEKNVAEKKLKAKKAASKPIMKKTEVVRMGTLKKSSSEDKKPNKVKSTVKKTETVKVKSGNKKTTKLGPISELKNLLKNKKAPKHTDKQNIHAEQVIGDSKFYVSKATVNRINEDEFFELPEGYGDNRIVIQVRDPYWLFAYWEVSQRKLSSVIEKFGNSVNSAKRVLRVYDITSVYFNGNNAKGFFDIEINDSAKNWYVNVGTPGRSYCIDIGLVLPDGRFVVLARSNFVTTPIDAPSMVTDEEWMIVEEDFNKLYGLSAGLGVGLSSGELRKQIKTRLKNLSSGVLSSPEVISVKPKRDFWMVVNTELIVYGATQPGSQLSVQGKPIELNEDGTFSLRFALPDGEQVIPVRAISPDKAEERVITPVVKKNTV